MLLFFKAIEMKEIKMNPLKLKLQTNNQFIIKRLIISLIISEFLDHLILESHNSPINVDSEGRVHSQPPGGL